MAKDVRVIKPELDRNHQYAVGVKIAGGGFCPIQSYETREQIERGFRQWYQMACQGGITKPIAVEKKDRGQEWDGAQCLVLRGLMEKIINGLAQ